MLRIAVLVSGGGTNLQALIDAVDSGIIKSGEIVTVVSSKPDVYALDRARLAGIKTQVIARKEYASSAEFDEALCSYLLENKIDLVVMAGFLCIVGNRMLTCFKDKMLNVHPSLIPSFCGDGFYGLKVHQAALDYGVKITGATVHFVNEVTDGGKIILQKAVEICDGDTAEILQKRVMENAEWDILPRAVELYCAGNIK